MQKEKQEPKVPVNFRLDASLMDALVAIATRERISVSEILRRAVREYVSRQNVSVPMFHGDIRSIIDRLFKAVDEGPDRAMELLNSLSASEFMSLARFFGLSGTRKAVSKRIIARISDLRGGR